MRTVSIFAVVLNLFLIITAICEGSPEDELVNAIRASYKVNVDRYIDTKKTLRDPTLTAKTVTESAIEELLAKLKLDLNSRDLTGDDLGSKAYNRIADQKRRRAEERIYHIQTAKDSGNQKMLLKLSIESLEEDLALAHVRLISFVAMLIEDDPDGKEPMTQDKNLETRVRDYWSIRNRLDVLKDAERQSKS